MRHALLTVSAVVLSLSCLDAGAAMYSYVDQAGVMHFTNVPADPKYRELPGFESVRREAARGRYGQLIEAAADRYSLDPELIRAVIKVESNYNPYAVSAKGAMGLMQLMPETAKEMYVQEPFTARDNIMGGSRYLRKLLNMFQGDLRLSLAAYNAGPNRVMAGGGIPKINETERYVDKVLSEYGRYRAGRLAEK